MALGGVHIAFGSAITAGQFNLGQTLLPFHCLVSQTMSVGGTSTIQCPGTADQAVLSISASAPIFYAVGPSPDPNNGPRRYMDPSFGREDIYCNPGDFFAWVLA